MAVSMTISVDGKAQVRDVYVGESQPWQTPDKGIVNMSLDGASISLWTTVSELRALTIQLANAANELERKVALRDGTPFAVPLEEGGPTLGQMAHDLI